MDKTKSFNRLHEGDDTTEWLLTSLNEDDLKKVRRRIEDRLRKDQEAIIKTALFLKIKWSDLIKR